MASKSTKKVRANRVEIGMTLATGEKVIDIRSQVIHAGWPSAPTTMISLVLDGAGEGGVAYAAGSSEWVEVKREQA